MSEIIAIPLTRLRSRELLGYCCKLAEILNQIYGVGGCAAAVDFLEALTNYQEAMASVATRTSLSDADAHGDQAYMGLYHQVSASALHPDPLIREAAEAVREVFSKTPNPTKLGHNEQYGALENLLLQLSKLPQSTLETALVAPFVTQLKSAVRTFTELSAAQSVFKSQRDVGATTRTRKALTAALHNLAKRLEVFTDMHSDDRAELAISAINVVNEKVKNDLSVRSDRKSTDTLSAPASDDITFDDPVIPSPSTTDSPTEA